MKKKSFFSPILLLIISLLPSSFAIADEEEVCYEDEYVWAGPYVGFHVGNARANADTRIIALPNPNAPNVLAPNTYRLRPRGWLGGVQAGWNWQLNNFVWGAETSFSLANIDQSRTIDGLFLNDGTAAPGDIDLRQRTKWLGTMRLRAGYNVWCDLLAYVTGGLAIGRVDYQAVVDLDANPASNYPVYSKKRVGWVAGAGLEKPLFWGFTLKIEYLYYNLGKFTRTGEINPTPPSNPDYQYTWNTSAHTAQLGINYPF